MVKAFIGLLIILFPFVVISILQWIAEDGLAFHSTVAGTTIVAAHLGVILGWYKLKSIVFRANQRCSNCERDMPLTGRQKCRSCGFRWEGHYFDKCPNCGGFASLIHCPHCELTNKGPWWYKYWHKLN